MKQIRFYILLFPFFGILFFAGCTKQRKVVNTAQLWDQMHIEARLYDVPVLINAALMQNISTTAQTSGSTIISYESTIPLNDAILFYQEQMERLGWKQTATFCGAESLLNFEKPRKYCSISLRPNKRLTRVIIFIGQKTSED